MCKGYHTFHKFNGSSDENPYDLSMKKCVETEDFYYLEYFSDKFEIEEIEGWEEDNNYYWGCALNYAGKIDKIEVLKYIISTRMMENSSLGGIMEDSIYRKNKKLIEYLHSIGVLVMEETVENLKRMNKRGNIDDYIKYLEMKVKRE